MKKKSISCIFMIAIGYMLASGVNTLVFAQNDEFTLEEITVTAEKREVNVQDTAMAVTAVAGADIREKAKNSLADVMHNLASVEVAASISGGQIYIRGVGAYGGDPATAVMMDDVYSSRSLAITHTMYDIDRVEVLRGPQGTLYGRNATAGIVNVISKEPVDKFEILGNFQVGDYNLKRFDGALNSPLSDSTAFRVAVLRETRDGYLSDGSQDSNVLSARAKLSYKPNNNFSVIGTVDYLWEKIHGNNTVPVSGSAGNLPSFMPWVDSDIVDAGWEVPPGADAWTNDEWHPGEFNKINSERTAYQIKINWDLGWGLMKVIPSYSEEYLFSYTDMLTGISQSPTGELTRQWEEIKQSSVEFTLASPSESAFEWLIGYYGMSSDEDFLNLDPGEEEVTDPTMLDGWNFVTDSDPDITHAFFGQATYPVTERFRVTGGLRYSKDINSLDYRYGNGMVDTSDPLYAETGGTGVYDSGWVHYEQDISSTTYKGGIEFDVNEKSMLYAQIATGFKAGGLNKIVTPTEYDPEELVAWEFGSKNRFMDNRIQLNLEAYHYKYTNMQAQFPEVTMIGSTGGSSFEMVLLNAEEGTNSGVDVECEYLISQNDKVSINLAYIDSAYGKLEIPPNPLAGHMEIFQLEDCQVAMSPEWAGTIGFEHTWLLENGAAVTGNFNTKISSGYYTTAEQYLEGAWQEGYTKSDIYVNYRSSTGKWTTGIWAKNLENDAQTIFIVPLYRRFVSDPRTFGVSVSFRY